MSDSSTSLYTVTVNLPASLSEDQASRFAESLGELPLSTSLMRVGDAFHGQWRMQWLMDKRPDPDILHKILSDIAKSEGIDGPTATIDLLPEVNWLEQSYRQFPPFSVARFFIHGSHYDGVAPEGKIPLQIDAATAFGSGEHGTTSGCLILMDQLQTDGLSPSRILDMGCGSGILSIAAAKLWGSPVLGVDIDPESVRVTLRHKELNKVGENLDAVTGDGFAVVVDAYDLIIANILPEPLKIMAGDLTARLTEGGHALLSGILLPQAQGVIDVYRGYGLTLKTHLERGEWAALLFEKD